ncbi:MAG: RnfH family protein [Bdellovibrionales bacterium]|nr:RnfH family protein [Ramlibacter sp.]
MPDSPKIKVTVVWSPGPREVHQKSLLLDEGATAAQALAASGFTLQFPELAAQALSVGVWGRKAQPAQALRDMDRLEIYRPLIVDPKVARRARFQKQGARSTGLFAKKRAGAKAGY